MQYAFDAWIPIVIFPQTMAPSFREFHQARCYVLDEFWSTAELTQYQSRLRIPGNVWIRIRGHHRGDYYPLTSVA